MTGVGQMLTDAREARGISFEQAERDTRISRRYLLALEAEEFSVFPARVYARGFLRSYASYVGLNPADLLALLPPEPGAAPEQAPGRPRALPQRPRLPEVLTESRANPRRPRQPAAHDGAGTRSGQPGSFRLPAASSLPPLRVPHVLRTRQASIGAGIAVLLLLVLVIGRCGGSGSSSGDGAGQSAGGAADPAFPLPAEVKGRMPDLRGMDETTALARLSELGITPFVVEIPSHDAPAGQIVRQSPPANTVIGRQTVTIVISRGG